MATTLHNYHFSSHLKDVELSALPPTVHCRHYWKTKARIHIILTIQYGWCWWRYWYSLYTFLRERQDSSRCHSLQAIFGLSQDTLETKVSLSPWLILSPSGDLESLGSVKSPRIVQNMQWMHWSSFLFLPASQKCCFLDIYPSSGAGKFSEPSSASKSLQIRLKTTAFAPLLFFSPWTLLVIRVIGALLRYGKISIVSRQGSLKQGLQFQILTELSIRMPGCHMLNVQLHPLC